MHKMILLSILFMTNSMYCAECKQQKTKNSHYQLHYHALYATRPADRFVEPIISCDIHPSSMQIKHGEVYQIDKNHKNVNIVVTTISFTPEQYELIAKRLAKSKRIFYLEAHNLNKGFWQLFIMDPNRIKIKKI